MFDNCVFTLDFATMCILLWTVSQCPRNIFAIIMQWWYSCISMSKQKVTSIALIVWSCMSIHLPAPLSFAQNFILHVFCSDTSFWNVLFCQTVWWLSESICQKHPGWSDNKLHANSLAPTHPPWKRKNLPLSNKAYRPIPRELALHVFDKWTYTSPSISRSSRAQGRQAPVYFPPSLSILNRPIRGCQSCIPARGWQVGSCDARAVHSFWWHSANICMVEAARLCLFSLIVSGNRFTGRQGGREMGIEPSRIKSFDCKSSDPGCLTCQFEVWLITREESLQRKQLVFLPAKLNL